MGIKLIEIFELAVCLLLCLSAGLIGSIFTTQSIPVWYANLNKAFFNPPSFVFAPVWTALYVLMGISAFLVLRKGFEKWEVKTALIAFLVQLALNSFWSIAFFGFRSPLFGIVVILLLWAAILHTMVLFSRISKPAMLLLVPYIAWVSFAAVLNISIWVLNI